MVQRGESSKAWRTMSTASSEGAFSNDVRRRTRERKRRSPSSLTQAGHSVGSVPRSSTTASPSSMCTHSAAHTTTSAAAGRGGRPMPWRKKQTVFNHVTVQLQTKQCVRSTKLRWHYLRSNVDVKNLSRIEDKTCHDRYNDPALEEGKSCQRCHAVEQFQKRYISPT